MTLALIGMGSNIEPEKYLAEAAVALREQFVSVKFSPVYRSKAVGMDGDDFLNACCLFEVDLSERALRSWLKSLEDAHGRDRSLGSWKPRTLDLDLLMLGGMLLDDDLYRYAHVLVPASALIGCQRPETLDVAAVAEVKLSL